MADPLLDEINATTLPDINDAAIEDLSVLLKSREFREHPTGAILSEAQQWERATTSRKA